MLASQQLSWPERFSVTIVPLHGDPSTYTVTTWLHQLKAVALAVGAHESRYGHDDDRRLYDVQVQALGRAPANPDGTVGPSRKDLADRMEW
jgi:hypothetical protein